MNRKLKGNPLCCVFSIVEIIFHNRTSNFDLMETIPMLSIRRIQLTLLRIWLEMLEEMRQLKWVNCLTIGFYLQDLSLIFRTLKAVPRYLIC